MKIEPCPKCGCQDIYTRPNSYFSSSKCAGFTRNYAFCSDCAHRGPESGTAEEALAVWNWLAEATGEELQP